MKRDLRKMIGIQPNYVLINPPYPIIFYEVTLSILHQAIKFTCSFLAIFQSF